MGFGGLTWWEVEWEGERSAAAREAGRGERRRRPMRRTRLSLPVSIAPASAVGRDGAMEEATGRERQGEAARDGAGRNGNGAPRGV